MGVRSYSSGKWHEFADCRVHSFESISAEREGLAAVFVHGRYGEAALWEPIVSGLEGAVRCVCIDLPGYGLSYAFRRSGLSLVGTASLVGEIVDRLSSDSPVILIGHDIGGTIALLSAIRLANRLAGLVLIGAACLTCPPAGLRPGLLARAHIRRIRATVDSSHLLAPEFRRRILEPWDLRGIRRSRSLALSLFDESWPRHYERLAWKHALTSMDRPALLLWGSEDHVAPAGIGVELSKLLPNAELLEHPEASHWLPLESPAWVSSRIREFLYRLGSLNARKSLSR